MNGNRSLFPGEFGTKRMASWSWLPDVHRVSILNGVLRQNLLLQRRLSSLQLAPFFRQRFLAAACLCPMPRRAATPAARPSAERRVRSDFAKSSNHWASMASPGHVATASILMVHPATGDQARVRRSVALSLRSALPRRAGRRGEPGLGSAVPDGGYVLTLARMRSDHPAMDPVSSSSTSSTTNRRHAPFGSTPLSAPSLAAAPE